MSNNPEMPEEKLHSPSLHIAFLPSITLPSQELTSNYSLKFTFSNHFL